MFLVFAGDKDSQLPRTDNQARLLQDSEQLMAHDSIPPVQVEEISIERTTFHYGVLLYTSYAVLHLLRTNWCFMWWTTFTVLLGSIAALQLSFADRIEPISSQLFFYPLLILIFVSSYFAERNTLRQWMTKSMLKEERVGFFETLDRVNQEVLIYSTDWEEGTTKDIAQFELTHANKHTVKQI